MNEIKAEKTEDIKTRAVMKCPNPIILQVDQIFNPDDDDTHALDEGLFVHRNLNIAPYYKEYRQERSKILHLL